MSLSIDINLFRISLHIWLRYIATFYVCWLTSSIHIQHLMYDVYVAVKRCWRYIPFDWVWNVKNVVETHQHKSEMFATDIKWLDTDHRTTLKMQQPPIENRESESVSASFQNRPHCHIQIRIQQNSSIHSSISFIYSIRFDSIRFDSWNIFLDILYGYLQINRSVKWFKPHSSEYHYAFYCNGNLSLQKICCLSHTYIEIFRQKTFVLSVRKFY